MSIIGRKTGRSAVAAAAYRSGEKLVDERTGTTHDYTKKRGIYESAILAPSYAPDWVCDREKLWNTVETVEKRHDAQLARDLDLALPTELSHFQKRSLVYGFFQRECVDRGMIADVNLHDFNTQNPHAHVMLSMRHLTEAGFGNKNRSWNQKEFLQQLRADWSDAVNLALARAGYEARIDHRSLEEQGVNRIPQIHLGPDVIQMEDRGIQTERGDIARGIDEANREIQSFEIRLGRTTLLIEIEQERERQRDRAEAEARARAEQAERATREREQREAEAQRHQAQIDHIISLMKTVADDLQANKTDKSATPLPKPTEFSQSSAIVNHNESFSPSDERDTVGRADSIQPPVTPEVVDHSAEWSAEIAPIAGRLFEYYAAQGSEADFRDTPTGTEAVYQVNAEDRVYWLSRNEQTGAYNLRGEDRDLDLSLNRGVTEKDRDIWRDWGNWLDQQPKPQPQQPKTVTLEMVVNLSRQDWLELTPRQQITLVDAAKKHRYTEPQGYAHPEQWHGQRSQLQKQLKEFKSTERSERETLKDLESRGERSFTNLFGVSGERLHDAREALRLTQSARKSVEQELKEIDGRTAIRQKQDAARTEWRSTSKTQGALQILNLIEQPDLKRNFYAIDHTYRQLVSWHERVSPQAREAVRVEIDKYLDGHGLSAQAQQAMNQPTRSQERSIEWER